MLAFVGLIACASPPGAPDLGVGVRASEDEGQGPPKAMMLVQRRSDSIFVTKLAKEGSVTTEYADVALSTPIHGGIVRYATQDVLALDYATKTLLQTTLSDAASEHRARLKARQDLLQSLGSPSTAAVPIRCSKLHGRIEGLEARAYLTTINDLPARLWYTRELPRPPREVRAQLADLAATDTSSAPPRQADDDACGDDDEQRELSAADLADSVLLKSETFAGGAWSTLLDTTSVARTTVSPSDFEAPSGWAARPALKAQTRAAAAPTVSQPIATVIGLGGPQLHQIEVHAFYWGSSFADPAHAGAVEELDNAIATTVGDGFARMLQYAIVPGELKSSHVIPGQPPAAVLEDGVSIVPTASFVSSVMSSYGPMFWWKWGPDPLIVVVVNSDEVGSTASWSGYHLDYLSPAFLLPFPVNLMANDFMPFALTTVTNAALEVPAGALRSRDSCPRAGAWCSSIGSFDEATTNLSHEIFEAASDPYEFSGFIDPSKLPPWSKAEIADICEDSPNDKTRVDDYVLSTFWSNIDGDCVGDYRSTVHLVAPRGVMPASAPVQASAQASAAIDRGSKLDSDTAWSVDGRIVGHGLSLTLPQLPPGAHHVTVTVSDANGYQATDEADFTLDAGCAAGYGGSCGRCGGTVQCDGSCSVPTPGNWGASCGSCGGFVQCDGSCSISTPGDFGQSCGCGGVVLCNDRCSTSCSLGVDFSNIDDDAYIWLDTPGFNSDPASSIAQINQGPVPRSGHFELGDWMRSQNMDVGTFIVKIGNGGCFNSHGDISFVMNGAEQWHGHKADTGPFTHCGWTYRAVITADIRAGVVSPVDENFCFNVTDCPY